VARVEADAERVTHKRLAQDIEALQVIAIEAITDGDKALAQLAVQNAAVLQIAAALDERAVCVELEHATIAEVHMLADRQWRIQTARSN
jgi:hypothetical protein